MTARFVRHEARKGAPRAYAADHATKYVQSCYSEAASLADEDGRIYGKVVQAPKGVGGAREVIAWRMNTGRLLKAAGDIQRSIMPREACAKVASGLRFIERR